MMGPDARALLDLARDGDDPMDADAARAEALLAARLAMAGAAGAATVTASKAAHAAATTKLAAGAGAATTKAAVCTTSPSTSTRARSSSTSSTGCRPSKPRISRSGGTAKPANAALVPLRSTASQGSCA